MFSQKPNSHRIFMRRAKPLIRLRICAGWSEALLVAHTGLIVGNLISRLNCYDIRLFLLLFSQVQLIHFHDQSECSHGIVCWQPRLCFVWFDTLRPSQHVFSHVGTGLPWLNQYYSPVAIIRNVKIRNIILLVAFFRTLSSNLDLEYPAVSEENCLKNPLPLPLPLISWEFRHF